MTTAEVISDRYCINSNGKEQLLFSEMELITCCKTLDDDPKKQGVQEHILKMPFIIGLLKDYQQKLEKNIYWHIS